MLANHKSSLNLFSAIFNMPARALQTTREMVSCLDHFSFLENQEDAEDEIKRKKVIIKERS